MNRLHLADDNLILHHHRLAILDITGGKQPMHYQHLTIIFNGQVYNHLDVRSKYQLKCTTNSDTETILQAYARVGPACLKDFDGMFVIAIYDRNKKELFIARDRAGKKPVYYFSDGKKLIFSSELNAIRNQVRTLRLMKRTCSNLCGWVISISRPHRIKIFGNYLQEAMRHFAR